MLARVFLALLLIGLAVPTNAQEPRRQLGPHSHGEGRLVIAIDGNRLEMDLEVPASDILGFEHAPASDAQEAALTEAKSKLGQLGGIFELTAEAGCKLASADVDVVGAAAEHDEHGHNHGHGSGADTAKAEDHHHEHGSHSEFRVTYAVECGSPEKLRSMAFDYFKVFEGAQKLDVTLVGPKGQSSYVVTREKPVLDLSGVS